MPEVNEVSLSAFNSNHEEYERNRPGYIAEAVDEFVKHLHITAGSKVVELAAGTGKFTEAIAGLGLDIVAVEPAEGMLHSFKKKFPEIPTIQASAYDMPFPDNSVEAVIIAQGFHWFGDKDALKEISRILRPGGQLGLIWNYEDADAMSKDGIQHKIYTYTHSFDKHVPQYHRMEWLKAFEDQPYFHVPIRQEHFKYSHEITGDPESLWKLWATKSYITSLPADKKKEARQHLYDLFDECDVVGKPIDVKSGVHLVWATKK